MERGFVELCPYIEEMNPIEFLNKDGRLLKKVDGETKEMIYLRTRQREGVFTPKTEDSNGNIPF